MTAVTIGFSDGIEKLLTWEQIFQMMLNMNQRFSPGSGSPLLLVGLLLLAACSSSGSDFGGGTSTGTGSGTAGSSVSGGDTSGGTGGDPTGGAGGNGTPGAGGNGTPGAGGNVIGAGGNNNGGGGAGPGTGVDGGGGGSPPAVCLNGYKNICHEFYANDNSRNQINYVNQFTSTNIPAGSFGTCQSVTRPRTPRTIEIVKNTMAKSGQAILASLNKGFAEFDTTDGTKLVSVLTQTGNVTGACRLPDGSTALGMGSNVPPIIRIVSSTGATLRQFNIPTGGELRAINRNPADGHFWFSKTETIYETDDQGNQLWQGYMGVGTKGYAVWWREGGGAYATTGEPASIVEVNNVGVQGTVVNTTGGQTVFPFLDFFSGFVRLKNGNYIVANWLGHLATPSPDAAQVVEFAAPCGVNAQGLGVLGPCAAPKNEVVWQWECPTCPMKNQTLSRQITNVYVLR
jgi:hypothetical protein